MSGRAAPSRAARKPGGGAKRPKPKQLPTGRHGLPPEFVVENQRTRLLIASAEVLAERGYSRATTQAIADCARVSKRTLYEQFSDVWDCLSAAYAVASDQLCEEISGACAGDDDWPERLSRGVDGALAWAAENPDFARLLSGEPPPTVEALRSARRELTERLAAQLQTGRSQRPDNALPTGLEERLIDAALSLVAARLMVGSANTLPELGPELTEILLRPYRKVGRS
jgi:AcrR family transcriptional regulator